MKRHILIVVAVAFATLWAQAVLASNISQAKQWETRGEYLKAAAEYNEASFKTDNLNEKAQLMYEVGRCRIKAGEIFAIDALIQDIKQYDSGHGASYVPKLLSQLEDFAWRMSDEEARQALSVIITEQPGRRQALSDKANAKNRKALAYWLNPALNEADCKAKRAKALKVKTVGEIAEKLAATRDACVSQPSETEYKAFADRVITELDTMAALPLYEQMKAIWGHLDESNINVLVTYGQKLRVIEGNEATVERIRQILPEEVVAKKLLRIKSLGVGNWQVLLTRGGERTPWMISSSVAGRLTYGSSGCDYTVVFEDGQRFHSRFNKMDPEDKKRFNTYSQIPNFYVVASPPDRQPQGLPNGMCEVGIIID